MTRKTVTKNPCFAYTNPIHHYLLPPRRRLLPLPLPPLESDPESGPLYSLWESTITYKRNGRLIRPPFDTKLRKEIMKLHHHQQSRKKNYSVSHFWIETTISNHQNCKSFCLMKNDERLWKLKKNSVYY